MRILTVLAVTALVSVSFSASAQTMRSSNDKGVQIQGKTQIDAEQKDVTAIAVGKDNVAKNTAGAIKGGHKFKATPRSRHLKSVLLLSQLVRAMKPSMKPALLVVSNF